MEIEQWDRVRIASGQATDWFVHTVEAVSGQWDFDGLGSWTVRDLAATLGRPLDVPPEAATVSLNLLGGLATQAGKAAPPLLTTTGRASLPMNFTVL